MSIKKKLLTRALDWATVEYLKQSAGLTSEWNQTAWMELAPELPGTGGNLCGTVCCLAGRVIQETGHVLTLEFPAWAISETAFGDEPDASLLVIKIDDKYSSGDIEWIAREELGLDEEQANILFGGNNTIFDLWRVAEDLTVGKVRIPQWLVPLAVSDAWDVAESEVAERKRVAERQVYLNRLTQGSNEDEAGYARRVSDYELRSYRPGCSCYECTRIAGLLPTP